MDRCIDLALLYKINPIELMKESPDTIARLYDFTAKRMSQLDRESK